MKKLILLPLLLILLGACENTPFKPAELQTAISLATEPSTEPSTPDNTSITFLQRKKQQVVIEAVFARRTTRERARQLASICFDKTLGTTFMPFDLAEIALVETGGHRLSARAVSRRGARGVWQLMPARAESHGYSGRDMLDDGKCAEAAVCELYEKLDRAQGDVERAKKLYCGQGAQATAYMKKIHRVRREMVVDLRERNDLVARADTDVRIQ